jgi:hypothetical protein
MNQTHVVVDDDVKGEKAELIEVKRINVICLSEYLQTYLL